MSVHLYYVAHRDTPLSDAERAVLERITDEAWQGLFEEATRKRDEWLRTGELTDELIGAREMFEPLTPGSVNDEPGELFFGGSKITASYIGEEPLFAQMGHYLAALTRLREAIPDAEWRVHVDEMDIPWENGRYSV